MKRRHNPARLHFSALASLLYGRFSWLHRHEDGSITCETGALAKELQTKYSDLCISLERLQEICLIEGLTHRKSYFICRPVPPIGMEWSPRHVHELKEVSDGQFA